MRVGKQVSVLDAPRMASWWSELFSLLYLDHSSPHHNTDHYTLGPSGAEESPKLELLVDFSPDVKDSLKRSASL
eukprot:3938743-Rhodomonas_salina.1